LNTIENPLAVSQTDTLVVLAVESVRAATTRTATAVAATLLSKTVRLTFQAHCGKLLTRGFRYFLGTARDDLATAEVSDALHELNQSILLSGSRCCDTCSQALFVGHSLATEDALKTFGAGVTGVHALANLADEAGVALAAGFAAAIVPAFLAFARAGVLTGDILARRNALGPARAGEPGFTGAAHCSTARLIRSAPVGRFVADRFTTADALSMSVGIHAAGIFGTLDGFPFGAGFNANLVRGLCCAEGFARFANLDRDTFSVLADCSRRTDQSFAVAGAIGYALFKTT
jgi:hypothetical protein